MRGSPSLIENMKWIIEIKLDANPIHVFYFLSRRTAIDHAKHFWLTSPFKNKARVFIRRKPKKLPKRLLTKEKTK